jgi:hypothetical protein
MAKSRTKLSVVSCGWPALLRQNDTNALELREIIRILGGRAEQHSWGRLPRDFCLASL